MSPYDAWLTFDRRDLEFDGWAERDEEPEMPEDYPEYFDQQECPSWFCDE